MSSSPVTEISSTREHAASVEVRRLYVRRHLRFLAEWLLLVLLAAAIWYAMGAGGLSDVDRFPPDYRKAIILHSYERFAVLAVVASILLYIIYYGTSYAVTPLGLFLPFIRKLMPPSLRWRQIGDEEELASPDDLHPKTPTAEELLDKAAEAEFEETPAERHEEDDLVSRVLRSSAHSAAKLAAKMERRINTHLIFGVLVGGAGLAVWWMSFYYGNGADKSADIEHYLMGAIPRVTILLFIEVLAGFFLRQYRIGVEDLKYFLELRRRAEAKRIAYAVFDSLDDEKAKISFAKAIMGEKSDTRLAKGETTTTLSVVEKEQNEIIKGLDVLGNRFEGIAKALKKSK